MVGVARQLMSLQNSQLRLNSLLLEERLFESAAALQQQLLSHYTMQVLQSVHRLVGSLDLLGNPASIFSDVSGGVSQFFYQPRKGLVKSPAAFANGLAVGTAGLAGGVIGGTSAGLAVHICSAWSVWKARSRRHSCR